ncbi:hypothetical protein BDB00DRAFT_854656 [Zychaea mexicana]|uniref:uncharacterized protein n=1 Tax=Zychaea mexicana TaxID=64656 RepID=UPI0022FEE0B6|nr:uncharacterized protein BDB00DRAFT_854656 [Zychaea mexicana]KAI9484549.1 hypothetical protein BDB00DRAFT_854656 [Zychaea mexicana]
MDVDEEQISLLDDSGSSRESDTSDDLAFDMDDFCAEDINDNTIFHDVSNSTSIPENVIRDMRLWRIMQRFNVPRACYENAR